MYDKYVGYKIKLYPTDEQINILNGYFDLAIFIYNLAIDLYENYHNEAIKNNYDKKHLTFIDLNNILINLKNTNPNYYWLNYYDSTVEKLVLKDLISGYNKYYLNQNNQPKYKNPNRGLYRQFPIRSERLMIYNDHVYIPSIKEIYTGYHNHSEIIGGYKRDRIIKFVNTRIVYDGLSYYLTLSIPENIEDNITINSCKECRDNIVWQNKPYSDPVGIDLGCKFNNWIVDSNGVVISLPDVSKEIKQIKKYDEKLQRQLNQNNILNSVKSVYERGYTKNEKKTIKKLLKQQQRITNRKLDVLHCYIKHLIELKPSAIVLENISSTEFINNIRREKGYNISNINSRIHRAMLYTVKDMIIKTAQANGIPVIIADSRYPSTQLCSCCGFRQYIGNNRIYRCPICGTVIDRDYNASLNLKKLAYESRPMIGLL